MNLVDTHAHLDFADDIDGWLDRAKADGVGKIFCVGTSVDASRKCVAIAEKYSTGDEDSGQARMTDGSGMQIYATVGIHAEDGKSDIEKYGSLYRCIDTLKQIALDSGKVVGVGECGFDVKSDRDPASLKLRGASQLPEIRKFQHELFSAQIELAAELKLPLVVHCRNAWEETFNSISNAKYPMSNIQCRGVFHSWTGDWEAAKRALNLGFYISFSGIVTFKNAPNVQEVARKMPIDRMLLETDSPFLAPEPMRGATNEPKNVKIVASFISLDSPIGPEKIVISASALPVLLASEGL